MEERFEDSKKVIDFKEISIGTGGKIMINVNGFYQFLLYKEKLKFK